VQSANVPSTAGFVSSVKITVGTASSASSAYAYLIQMVEGYNWADMRYGSAAAQTATLSFWVKSSVAGTYGICFRNTGTARFYTTTYTISAADTWEYKTITITGDTSGTWLTTNGIGFQVIFDLGVGTTYSTTSNNAWTTVGSNYFGVTGTTKLASTAGATFNLTGLQLEAGSVATSFERVDYSEMLRRCQRYYFRNNPPSSYTAYMAGSADASNSIFLRCDLPVAMRANPTFSQSNTDMYQNTGSKTIGAITNRSNIYSGSILVATSGATSGDGARLEASGGLGSIGYVDFSAEL